MQSDVKFRWSGVLAAGILGVLALGAQPARAGDDFERAFESELGRLAAHEAVHFGRHVLIELLGERRAHPPRYRSRSYRRDYRSSHRRVDRHPRAWRHDPHPRAWRSRGHSRYLDPRFDSPRHPVKSRRHHRGRRSDHHRRGHH